MLFSSLSEKIQKTLKAISKKNKLSKSEIKKSLEEIEIILLDSDVNLKVVKELISSVENELSNNETMDYLTPYQNFIKVIKDKLTNIMTISGEGLNFSNHFSIIMLCGLQGAGKTTTSVKLAKYLKDKKMEVGLCAADPYRPGAVEQLKVLAQKAEIEVFYNNTTNVKEIVKDGIKRAKENGREVLLIDTAGRLQIDEKLMNELCWIKKNSNPSEVLLVLDAMTGQEAANVAMEFDNKLGITGTILTKLDGDASGGGALSIAYTTQKPIKFWGTGEKIDDLEIFYPERMVNRILGMGDILSLIEKAEKTFTEEETARVEENLKKGKFTLWDFRGYVTQFEKMGSFKTLEMLPGITPSILGNLQGQEKKMTKVKVIIDSMTKTERENEVEITYKRKKRISKGSGTSIAEVNTMLEQFNKVKQTMKIFAGPSLGAGMKKGIGSDILGKFGDLFKKSPLGYGSQDSGLDLSKLGGNLSFDEIKKMFNKFQN